MTSLTTDWYIATSALIGLRNQCTGPLPVIALIVPTSDTRFEWEQAAELAAKAVCTVGQVLVEEYMSPTQFRQTRILHDPC